MTIEFFNTINSFRGEYNFLSNFYLVKILYDGKTYPSVENAYQAAKSDDQEFREALTKCSSRDAKKAGNEIIIKNDWDRIKIKIMYELLQKKFSYNDLKIKLCNTGVDNIIEGNTWHDNFWGICYCGKCNTKTASNVLGVLLMKVRHECVSINTKNN